MGSLRYSYKIAVQQDLCLIDWQYEDLNDVPYMFWSIATNMFNL